VVGFGLGMCVGEERVFEEGRTCEGKDAAKRRKRLDLSVSTGKSVVNCGAGVDAEGVREERKERAKGFCAGGERI
jgi:hypothetical protein